MSPRGMSSRSKRMKEIYRVRVWKKKGVENNIDKLSGGLRAARGHSPPLPKKAPYEAIGSYLKKRVSDDCEDIVRLERWK